VKRSFRDFARSGVYEQSSSEPIVASEDERRTNPRARSAKVRWAQRAAGHD
jgi:16S rRNA (cytosine1402-N4)-methyltransferase